jgi:hypothetical protein
MSAASLGTIQIPAHALSALWYKPETTREAEPCGVFQTTQADQTAQTGAAGENSQLSQLSQSSQSGDSSQAQPVSGRRSSQLTDAIEVADITQSFCEWLSAVRTLQKDPWEKKKTIISFVMLVFHSGVNGGDSTDVDSLSKDKLDMISKAPGWNNNEQEILTVLKDHFYTIRELSASGQSGICYEDLANLFSNKRKLKDLQRVAASTQSAKAGFAAGFCAQIILMFLCLPLGLAMSLLLAIVGGLVGAVTQQSSDGAFKTALAGALWGISAGSGLGAALGAKRAGEYFDNNLSDRIDYLRQDLKALRFD